MRVSAVTPLNMPYQSQHLLRVRNMAMRREWYRRRSIDRSLFYDTIPSLISRYWRKPRILVGIVIELDWVLCECEWNQWMVCPIPDQSISPLAWTECGDSLPFSGASSIPPNHTLFPATPLRQPFFHPPSLHPAIYFLVYLLVLLFPNLCTILFWKSYFLPFSVHVQTNVIYAALLSLL